MRDQMQENVEQKYDFDLEATLGSHVERKSKNLFPLCFAERFKSSAFCCLQLLGLKTEPDCYYTRAERRFSPAE